MQLCLPYMQISQATKLQIFRTNRFPGLTFPTRFFTGLDLYTKLFIDPLMQSQNRLLLPRPLSSDIVAEGKMK